MIFQEARILYAFVAAICFATTTISLRMGYDTGDQRYTLFAFVMLSSGYLFMMPLIGDSLSYASVIVSALTQILALGYALGWLQEPVSGARVFGIVCSLAAIIAFSLPSNSNS
ncbi:MAG: hypothetical protein AAGA97_04235 [Pseudomonadota bacterium]